MVEGLSKVLIVMSRGLVYERQLQNQWATKYEGNIVALKGFLVDLYEQTLIFLVNASDHYTKGSLQRTWNAVWNAGEITDFDKKTTKIQYDLQIEAGISFELGLQGDLSSVLESNKSLCTQLGTLKIGVQEILSQHEQQRLADLKRQKDDERAAVLKWLSKFQYVDHHNSAKRERVEDTGNWIFERNEYQRWHKSREQHILWIHGIRKSQPWDYRGDEADDKYSGSREDEVDQQGRRPLRRSSLRR